MNVINNKSIDFKNWDKDHVKESRPNLVGKTRYKEWVMIIG